MAENNTEFDEIDEAQEEALLKSDDDAVAEEGNVNEDALMSENVGDDNLSNEDGIDDNESEDDDFDSDSDAYNRFMIQYHELLKELKNDPYSYDKYVKLCQLSHKTDELNNIRMAYNLFAAVYPLTAEIWLEYLKIEVDVAVNDNEILNVDRLFQKALRDYYSVDVALEHAAFSTKTVRPEEIWDEILGTYGLHCMKGNEIFNLYRSFVSELNISENEKTERYVKSYVRQLKLPLLNMEDTYIEFKVKYEQNKMTPPYSGINWEVVENDYTDAKEDLQKILPHEQKLLKVHPEFYEEKANIYREYIKDSDKFLDENILQTIYERLVADCCLNGDCWLEYVSFLEFRDRYGRPKELSEYTLFQQDVMSVCNRALRNCSWNEKLYIKKIHLLENSKADRKAIQEVLETSLSTGFYNADPVVAIWLEYLTYLRRTTDYKDEEQCEILRKNFNLCWTSLGQQWGVLADCECEILQFWGRLEYGELNDPKKGKELWNTVMESSNNSSKSGLWIEFTELERRRDVESTRNIFRKAIQSGDLDNPYVVISSWQRFERCCGSVSQVTKCQRECEAFLHDYRRKFEDSFKKTGPKPKVEKKHKDRKRKASEPIQEDTGSEKKPNLDIHTTSEDKPDINKIHENQALDPTKDHLSIFVSNLDYNLKEDDISKELPELAITTINLIRSANGRSRGFAYILLQSEGEVEKALLLDRKKINGRPIYISSVLRDKEKRQKFKYSGCLEPKKVFIKGLPPNVSKEELEGMFGVFGKIKDVRLVYHKSGKFKGIAYVEFDSEDAALLAVKQMNDTELRDHTVSVAISAPPPKPSTSKDPSGVKQILGMTGSRRPAPQNQKPRMSLIPNVVQRQLNITTTSVTSENGSTKTNEDFRKLLVEKKQ